MLSRFISVGLLGFSFASICLPALARPEIASGDQWLEGISQSECLNQVDQFLTELNVPFDTGTFDRTGFFEDGVFRALCYSGGAESSLLMLFTAHAESAEDATQFMQFALQEITGVSPSDN